MFSAVERSVNVATAARGAMALAALSVLLLAGTQRASAHTETVLYRFQGGSDGANPAGGTPVFDSAANLYGTTYFGGTNNIGTVWKLTPSGTETVLWSFGTGMDGASPNGLIMDNTGNLYGMTYLGGAYNRGTAWKLTPSGTETVLWSFGNGRDGSTPSGPGPILDSTGDLYGTTAAGGANNIGTVWKLTPSGTETILYSFGANPKDDPNPEGLMLAKNGNFYGTTYGISGLIYPQQGTVWELTPSGTETVLYSFDPLHTKPRDGELPTAPVIMDKQGNLFGTCHNGGNIGTGTGTVFELTPSGNTWTETILHSFHTSQGATLYSGLARDKKGNLYSTAYVGGIDHKGGTVWKLTPSGHVVVLHYFDPTGTDGYGPVTGVVLDGRGNLYGTTENGGGTTCQIQGRTFGCGTVYKVTL